MSRHKNQTHDLAIKHRCHGRCRTVVTPAEEHIFVPCEHYALLCRRHHCHILKRHLKRLPAEVALQTTSDIGTFSEGVFYQKVVKRFTAALLLMQKAAVVVRIVGLCRSVCMQVHPVLFVSEIITK